MEESVSLLSCFGLCSGLGRSSFAVVGRRWVLLYKLSIYRRLSRQDICEVDFYLIENAAAVAMHWSLRGFPEKVMAAGGARHTVDANHPTRTLALTRTLWGDLCLDAK